MQLGNLDVGKAFPDQAVAEGLLDIVFAVDDEEGLYLSGVLASEELGEVFVVAVGAHAADAADLGVDFVEDAENMYLFCAGHEAAAEGMGFAVADEEDGIAGVLDVIADVVHNPAAVGHATGGDDDKGVATIVEQFGFIHRFDEFEALEGERVFVVLEDFLDGFIEILRVMFHDLGGGNAKGAVDVVVERRETALFFELIEREEQFLGSADAEGGDDELALFLQAGLYDPVEEHIGRGADGVVQAVAVGGFDQDIICLGEYLRRAEDNVLVAADVPAEGYMILFILR
jgi:hypothetical protein